MAWVLRLCVGLGLLAGAALAQPAAPAASVEQFTPYSGHAVKLYDEETLLRRWIAVEMPGRRATA